MPTDPRHAGAPDAGALDEPVLVGVGGGAAVDSLDALPLPPAAATGAHRRSVETTPILVTPVDTPIVLPAAAVGVLAETSVPEGYAPIVPAMPVLAPLSRAAAPPRPGPSAEHPAAFTATVAPTKGKRSKHSHPAFAVAPTKQKRHRFRSFVTFVLVVGVLGAAGYAGWYRFVRKDVVWSKDVQPSADFVETVVHHAFDQTVPVVTLAIPEYEAALGLAAIDRLDPSDDAADLVAFRAVGLVAGTLDPPAVGHLLAPSMPSFYDGASRSVYRVDGTSPITETALVRSLTLALVDQQVDFTKAMPSLTTSQRMGYWAMLDAIAADAVAARRLAEPSLAAGEAADLLTRLTAAGVDQAQVPWYLAEIVGASDAAPGRAAAGPGADAVADLRPPASDAAFFDPSLSTVPSAGSATSGPAPESAEPANAADQLGLEFWYETIVSSVGVDAARAAALLWTGDTTTIVDNAGQACLRSTITTARAQDATSLQSALGTWARSRPASSAATATIDAVNPAAVDLASCEPTETGQLPPQGSVADMRVLFNRSAAERTVVERTSQLAPPGSTVSPACVVAATRNGALGAVDESTVDALQAATLSNVAAFCQGG